MNAWKNPTPVRSWMTVAVYLLVAWYCGVVPFAWMGLDLCAARCWGRQDPCGRWPGKPLGNPLGEEPCPEESSQETPVSEECEEFCSTLAAPRSAWKGNRRFWITTSGKGKNSPLIPGLPRRLCCHLTAHDCWNGLGTPRRC